MMRCPSCRAVFDMLAPGQLVMAVDDKGWYMEHVPCGHRGRPGDGAKPDPSTGAAPAACQPPGA